MEDQAQTIEKKRKSVEEAVQAALEEFNCDLDDVVVEIIEIGRASCRERV